MQNKEKTKGVEKDKIKDETNYVINHVTNHETNKDLNQETNQDSNHETKMSSEAKAVYNSHPNLKSAPSDWSNNVKEEPGKSTKQGSTYGEGNRCAPNNNIFFEERSNHLSSKGD